MTKQEMLAAAEILKAAGEGKKIQCRYSKTEPWMDITGRIENHSFNLEKLWYRVKPEPCYRPYENVAEVAKDLAQQKTRLIVDNAEENLLQVEEIYTDGVCVIVVAGDNYGETGPGVVSKIKLTYRELLDGYVWSYSGTPCGYRIEEENESTRINKEEEK